METRDPEIWKPIPGYEGLYEVSSWGRVKSLEKRHKGKNNSTIIRKEKLLKCYIRDKDYVICRLYIYVKKGKNFQVHRLVAQVFLKPKNGFNQINHIDLNPMNNYYKNLEFVNSRENQTHRYLNSAVTSTYPGVSYKKDGKRKKRWKASFNVDGKTKSFGIYESEIEAYKAYLNALKESGLINKYAIKTQEKS